jgi:N-hydroxyarylamine O-acetyltransferase
MLLLIELDGERYVADVGFGPNTLTGPLLLDARRQQTTPHGPYQVIEAGDQMVLQAKVRDAWMSLYTFDLREQLLPDLEMGNWYTSTHPNSLFVNNLMVARVEPGGRYALRNNELAHHTLKGATERRTLATVRELREVLSGTFELTLPGPAELDLVLARFVAPLERRGSAQ